MKKLIALLFLFPLLFLTGSGQVLPPNSTVLDSKGEAHHEFAGADSSASFVVGGTGYTNHRINWVPFGSPATATCKLEQSVDAVTWTDLITGANCTSAGVSALTEASTNFVRITVTALTGAGARVRVYYQGLTTASGSSTAVSSIAAGDNNIGNVDVVTLPTVTANATLAAETTKVIGTVNQGTSPWVTDTELPAAAALADDMANPTAPAVGANMLIWNGATWERWNGTVTGYVNASACALADTDQQTTSITTTGEATIVTAVADERHHIMAIDITASTAVAFAATVKDSTAGTTQAVWLIKDASNGFVKGNGGGILLRQKAAVNNNWTLTLSASSVTVQVNVTFCKD